MERNCAMNPTRRPIELLKAANQEISSEIKFLSATRPDLLPEEKDRLSGLEAAQKKIEEAVHHLVESYHKQRNEVGNAYRAKKDFDQ
jgi:deoxyribodipyrimidine photolyase